MKARRKQHKYLPSPCKETKMTKQLPYSAFQITQQKPLMFVWWQLIIYQVPGPYSIRTLNLSDSRPRIEINPFEVSGPTVENAPNSNHFLFDRSKVRLFHRHYLFLNRYWRRRVT